MPSSAYALPLDTPPLGRRRGLLDLARFSLDTSLAAARERPYPSPPMSGSPTPPLSRRESGPIDGGSGVVLPAPGTFVHSSLPEYQRDIMLISPQEVYPTSFRYHPQSMSSQLPYIHPTLPPIPAQPQYPSLDLPPPAPLPGAEKHPQLEDDESSSKMQRKPKGHVASACVPCKRAHLRCDAQRPCSRCLGNGKEDSCIDVQHKKRGRPRLRDEREPRYEGLGNNYHHSQEPSMRQPPSTFPADEASMSSSHGDQTSSAYKVLKSQTGGGPVSGSVPGSAPPRHLEPFSSFEATQYAPPPRTIAPPDTFFAYLSTELQLLKASPGFNDAIGQYSILSRSFYDLVCAADRDRVHQLQRAFEYERRDIEPHYLPPIVSRQDQERAAQSVGFSPGETMHIRTDRHETLTFPGVDGQQRTAQARFGLLKVDTLYYILVVLVAPHILPQSSPSIYGRDPSRETHYGYQAGYQAAQHGYAPPSPYTPSGSDSRSEAGTAYQPPGGPESSNNSPNGVPPYAGPYARRDAYQTIPRSELPQTIGPPRSNDLQLPPIREQLGGPGDTIRGRGGRVDIGGLLL